MRGVSSGPPPGPPLFALTAERALAAATVTTSAVAAASTAVVRSGRSKDTACASSTRVHPVQAPMRAVLMTSVSHGRTVADEMGSVEERNRSVHDSPRPL